MTRWMTVVRVILGIVELGIQPLQLCLAFTFTTHLYNVILNKYKYFKCYVQMQMQIHLQAKYKYKSSVDFNLWLCSFIYPSPLSTGRVNPALPMLSSQQSQVCTILM